MEPPPKKALGQHWLTDQSSLQAMVNAAELTPEDIVLEIGPGLGNLTELLVLSAKKVFAVEFDEPLAKDLPNRVQASNLEAINADIRLFNLNDVPANYKVVANIPYYLTSNLLQIFEESTNAPVQMALLVQKEVAERIAAKPGDMSVLSVSVQFYYQPELDRVVTADMFTPPPQVDSQIIKLKKHPKPLFPDVDPKLFFKIVKAGFSNRRKTLSNSLAAGLSLDKGQVIEMIQKATIDPNIRAQELSLQEWHRLYIILAS